MDLDSEPRYVVDGELYFPGNGSFEPALEYAESLSNSRDPVQRGFELYLFPTCGGIIVVDMWSRKFRISRDIPQAIKLRIWEALPT